MTNEVKTYRVLGLMSGTSLDGLDIALCEFNYAEKWSYRLILAETIKYGDQMKGELAAAERLNAADFMQLNQKFGAFSGKTVNDFLLRNQIAPQEIDAIASHGHTIFHQPHNGFTTQIGCGATIAAQTGLTTICDFRSVDVALGGQGAPLVPIGDQLLFSDFDYRLNLGGIANASFDQKGTTLSFDICFANIISNYLVAQLGKEMDESGNIARSGKLDQDLLNRLNEWSYFEKDHPKSLGKESFVEFFQPILTSNTASVEDQLHTFGHHLAQQISKVVPNGTCLVTGGGAYNKFWVELLSHYSKSEILTPERQLIDFKEAMIFAFLGVLRLNKLPNALSSVTGASSSSVGGAIYLGN